MRHRHLRSRLLVSAAGARLPAAVGATLSSVIVRQVLAAPAVAELEFHEPPDAGLPEMGAALELAVEGAQAGLFAGTVTALAYEYDARHGRVVRVRAHDALQRARTRKRIRAIENTSAAGLARELADELGLSCTVQHDAPGRDLVIQAGESDLELLVRLAAACGLFPVLTGGELRLAGLDGGEPLPLVLGRGLLSATVTLSGERAIDRAEVSGWDPLTSRRYQEAATTARQDAQELRGSPSQSAKATSWLIGSLAQSAAEAQAKAQAAMDMAAATEAVATGDADGDPALHPGTAVSLAGLAEPANGRFVLTEVVHAFDADSGYVSSFSSAPPDRLTRGTIPAVMTGQVLDIEDPQELGRCRVRLVALGDIQSGWLQVLVPGAGAAKGLVALPDIDDIVLVLLSDGDPARGFVLGGLYGEQGLPRGAGVRRKRPFVLRTAGGQGLELGSDAAIARLSTHAGSLLELTPGRTRLAAASDLVIEAPGRTITLRANAIKLERG